MLLLSVLAATSSLGEVPFYVGTYTSPGGSKGIYSARLNTETGKISDAELAYETPNPSFVTYHPNGRYLYSINESSSGEANAYGINGRGGLALIGRRSFDGAGPCHLSVDAEGKFLLIASYGGGTVAWLPIQKDGSLGESGGVFHNEGTGPNKTRQDKSHMHSVVAHGGFAYACDLGTDEVLTFRVEGDGLALTRRTKTIPGAGPRHLVVAHDGRFLYVNNELDNTVTAYRLDASKGELTAVRTLSTLPKGVDAKGFTTAEVRLHPNGRWLYVSNRGHDSIAVFGVASTGDLELIGIDPAHVREPRRFDVDPSGRWLVVAGQSSNDLTALRIDPGTGRLRPTGQTVGLVQPVCIAFPP